MKKTSSRTIGLIIAVLMVLAILPLASAGADGPPETGSLTITKYVMPDKSTASVPADGTQASEADVPAGATPLAGVTFKLYTVTIGADEITPVSGEYILNNYANPTSMTDEDGNVFTVTYYNSYTTGTGGAVNTGQIPRGIYLAVEQSNPDVTEPADPFVVSVPMTDAAGTGWLDPVFVYPKNEMLTFTKTAVQSAVSPGDVVTFELVAGVPSNLASTTGYKIVDHLPSELDFKNVSSVVAATSKSGLSSGTALVAGTDYTVTTSGQDVTISFTAAGLAKLAAGNYRYIQVTLNATVNGSILSSVVTTNTASIDFKNKWGEDQTVDSNGEPIHTATVAIDKVDAKTGAKLPNASFVIASSSANAAAGNYLHKAADGTILDVGDTGYAAAPVWTVTTNGSGAASFTGLADYTEDAGGNKTYLSYWLVETAAPSTYNLLSSPVQVTFSAANSTEDNGYTMTVTVKNNKGFMLPLTGDKGIIVFTVAGIVLIGIAILLVVTSKRKKAAEVSAK